MANITVEAKGQITLTQDMLRHLNLTPDQKVEYIKLPDGRLVLGAAPKASSGVRKVAEDPRAAKR